LGMVDLIPEVQMNLGYAVPNAGGTEDIVAFPGRIGHHQGKVVIKSEARFGASSHVARLILTYMKVFPFMRACANLRYSKEIITRAEERGLAVVFVDRAREPAVLKEEEGRSLDFIVEEALKGVSSPPDIVFDEGDTGKEPIVRLFARDPDELLHKMEMIWPWRTS
jgi:hydroxymethylpyrimidine kinase / phosphomethylpyrimidine kinase / thiamine-phosphate diphosphorylase